jgi:hypothetical protein
MVAADFRNVLASKNLVGIASVVRIDDWDTSADEFVRSRYLTPAYLALEHCVQQALSLARTATEERTGAVERVSFVFDLRDHQAARCNELAASYQRGWPNSEWFEGISFANVQNVLPLQAADMLAYETYRLENERIKTGKEPDLRVKLSRLLEGIPILGGYYNEESFKNLSAQIRASSGAHSPGGTVISGEQSS